MNIGLFMGSFDPIHIGHIEAVFRALREMDEIFVVPTPQNPLKEKAGMRFEDKVILLKQVFWELDAKKIKVVPGGTEDELKEPETELFYSYIQLGLIKNQFPDDEFYIIGGEDVDVRTWKNGDWIMKNFKTKTQTRSTIPLSSTMIRKMIKDGKQEAQLFVPSVIWNYIKTHKLYEYK